MQLGMSDAIAETVGNPYESAFQRPHPPTTASSKLLPYSTSLLSQKSLRLERSRAARVRSTTA